MKSFFLGSVLVLLAGCQSQYNLQLKAWGVYSTNDVDRAKDDRSLTGYSSSVDGKKLIAPVNVIYLDDVLEGQFFGFDYCVEKFVRGKAKTNKKIELKVVITNPPITNPKTKKTYTTQVYTIELSSFLYTYEGYIFSEAWERVPGDWKFDYFLEDELIGTVNFLLLEGSAPTSGDEVIYAKTDERPNFSGGDKAVSKFVASELRYPEEARELFVQGQVVVGFVVEKDGSLTDLRIVKGVHPSLDNETLRLISEMPNWNPATMNGAPVRAYSYQALRFSLMQ